MTQLSTIEVVADQLSQKLEQDIALAEENLSTADGLIIISRYIDEVNAIVNNLVDGIPRGLINSLSLESIDILSNQAKQERLAKINRELAEQSGSQMNHAVELLLANKGDTPEYGLLVTKITEIKLGLWAVQLMQK